MALQAQYENIDSKTMHKDLKLLTKKYTLSKIRYVKPLWVLYYKTYHDDISRNSIRDIFKYFIKMYTTPNNQDNFLKFLIHL